MSKHYGKDSELLQLFLNQRDSEEDATELYKQARFRQKIKSSVNFGQLQGSPRFEVENDFKPSLGLADDMEEHPNNNEIKKLYHELMKEDRNHTRELLQKLEYDQEEIQDNFSLSSNCLCCNCVDTTDVDEREFLKEMKKWAKQGGTRKHLRDVLKKMELEKVAKETIGRQVTKEEIKSFQNQVYRFTQLMKPHKDGMNRLLAMDISFDGFGCTYILEWALESVCSINFHSHFHNKSNPVKRNLLYNQITLIRLPSDFFSLPGTDQTKLDRPLDDVYFDSIEKIIRCKRRDGIGDEEDRYINFITVGPIKEDAKRVTVNLLLERLHDGKDIADNALMLAIKPLKIAGNIVSDKYLRYTPSYSLFSEHLKPSARGHRRSTTTQSLPPATQQRRNHHYQPQRSLQETERLISLESPLEGEEEVPLEREIKSIEKLVGQDSLCTVGNDRGVICYCAGIECVFEMKLYHYKWKQEMRIDVETLSV